MAITFQTDDLSSNRSSALPNGTLQLVAFYDGSGLATLSFETKDTNGALSWTTVKDIPSFSTQIVTKQYTLKGEVPTGNFVIEGVVANGVVDGVAFGLLWRDLSGGYHILRSNGVAKGTIADFVSAWPLGMNNTVFAPRVSQVTDGYARETALAVISGAKLLPSGKHSLQVF